MGKIILIILCVFMFNASKIIAKEYICTGEVAGGVGISNGQYVVMKFDKNYERYKVITNKNKIRVNRIIRGSTYNLCDEINFRSKTNIYQCIGTLKANDLVMTIFNFLPKLKMYSYSYNSIHFSPRDSMYSSRGYCQELD